MQQLVRFLLRCFFRLIKVRVANLPLEKDLPDKGIYISNHVSWLDPVILFAFLPHNPVFLLHPKLYRNHWLRFFLCYADVREFNYMDAAAVKKVIALVNNGRYCMMFPEGCMTDSGDIMKVYEAPAIVADRTDAPLIPIWISGAEYSPFSETTSTQPHRPFPKIKIKIGKPEYIHLDASLRKNRDYLRDLTYHRLNTLRFSARYKSNLTLMRYLLRVSRIYGKIGLFRRREIIEDSARQPKTYMDLILGAYALGRRLTHFTTTSENVALLLPNSVGLLTTFLGLSAYNRVPVMINFSQGPTLVASMCHTAMVKTIITSREFIEKAKLTDLITSLTEAGQTLIYLEDIVPKISLSDKLCSYVLYKLKRLPVPQSPDDPATILFTSGSEGLPKAVVLSHRNIISNTIQIGCSVQLTTQDLLFNFLPMFHSFGLVVGTLFPLFQGAKTFLFPSPLLYRTITELLYELKATMVIGTNTFFRAYTKVSHPYDFRTLRYCIAGAEAVQAETRNLVAEHLGCLLLEGYGTTECSPVISINTILFNRFGTLGKAIQGIEYRIEPVDGISEGGELCVKGPNIMKGYMYPDNPGVLVPVPDGWYHTGDVVTIDELGFIKMRDRIKRFAKIAGEMVSLTAVEHTAHALCPSEDFHCGAVSVPHATKGEQIILVSNDASLTRDSFASQVQKAGLSELYIPSQFLYKESLPVFATGKADKVSLKKWVLEQLKTP